MTNKESDEKMTRLQQRFGREYIIDFMGTDAYVRASGKSNRKSAAVQASKLLKMPKVDAFIKAYAQEQLGPLEKDLLGNVNFWIEVRDKTNDHVGTLVSLQKVIDLILEHTISSEEAKRVIKEIQKLHSYKLPEARTADRLKASEQLAKYRSMFVEKKDVHHDIAVTIVDDIK